MWTPEQPSDMSRFQPEDMPAFMQWWENQQLETNALGFLAAYVEGLTLPYTEALAAGGSIPQWVETMLHLRSMAQWAYERSIPVSGRALRQLDALLPVQRLPGYNLAYLVSPGDIARIPDEVRRSFVVGSKFSMGWIRRLSQDARETMRDLISINQIKGNPVQVMPILEQVLRRDQVAQLRRIAPRDVTQEQIDEWFQQASYRVIESVAIRARAIAKTESMRMMNIGTMDSLVDKNHTNCYVMPHVGTCDHCRRLLDGRVFRIAVLRANMLANFGVKPANWVASIPQHPNCRHSILQVPYKFKRAIEALASIPDEGIVLEWYGLPGGESDMDQIGLEKQNGWLRTA